MQINIKPYDFFVFNKKYKIATKFADDVITV